MTAAPSKGSDNRRGARHRPGLSASWPLLHLPRPGAAYPGRSTPTLMAECLVADVEVRTIVGVRGSHVRDPWGLLQPFAAFRVVVAEAGRWSPAGLGPHALRGSSAPSVTAFAVLSAGMAASERSFGAGRI